MTIFFVNPMGYGTLGKYDYNIVSNFQNTTVLYLTNTKSQTHNLDQDSMKIYDYSSKKGIFKALSYIRSQYQLLQLAKSKNPRVVHFQWLKTPRVDLLLIKRLKRNSKTILTVHNLLPHSSGNRFKAIYKKIYLTVDQLIVHTARTKEELVKDYHITAEKIQIIPHGTFPIENLDRDKTANIKSAFVTNFKTADKVVFGVLGRINAYKGIPIIAEAWRKLTPEKRGVMHLLIAGEGKSTALEYIEGLDNTTVVNEAISDEEFQSFLEVSDFLLLPYLQISQSGFLLTALSNRKRVIVSNRGGLTEPFSLGKVGYIIEEPLNAENVKSALLEALDNKDIYPDETVWEKVLGYYDWKNIARSTEALYLL
ncbi:MAG: glycosyltransferase family 4 protein [Bacteroidota bacterium]